MSEFMRVMSLCGTAQVLTILGMVYASPSLFVLAIGVAIQAVIAAVTQKR